MFIQIVWDALNKFNKQDKSLFNGKQVKEECINHRIALYLQEMLLSRTCGETTDLKQKLETGYLKIDIEYDKLFDELKTINHKSSRPDILIHHRGDNSYNYAYIELKKQYRNKRDTEKCVGAKKAPYNYTYVLIIDCLNKPVDKMRVIEIIDDSGNEKKHSFSTESAIAPNKTMTIHDQTISKIRQLPEALAQEVNDFIDFLLFKQGGKQWQRSTQLLESTDLAEMANDPEIQAEMAAIDAEFAVTEDDGLPSV